MHTFNDVINYIICLKQSLWSETARKYVKWMECTAKLTVVFYFLPNHRPCTVVSQALVNSSSIMLSNILVICF